MTAKAPNAAPAPSTQPAPHHTVWDRFDNGFSVGTPDARWIYFEYGPFVSNDGVATTSAEGLRVVPKGMNPSTGKPAYTVTLAPETDATGVPGQFDHCKWLVYANHKASTGVPGFDAVRGQTLAFETWMSAQMFGTHAHPFGSAVQDPDDDLRLAMAGQNAIDLETGMVFDFLFSNKRLYAFYERLTFARTPQNNYAAFTYCIPVADRTPDTLHHTKIAYDRAAGVVRWLVDGKEVFRVNKVGRRIDPKWQLMEHGGEEEEVEMRQLNCGMGMFTLLDASGLVRLAGNSSYYQPPHGKEASKLQFVDEESQPRNRLFGQGAELRLQRYIVSSTPNSP
jgi:hypothetical protein